MRKSAMLRYCMALPLWNEPKHSYVGSVVTEIIYFLSRTVELRDIAQWSQAQISWEEHILRNLPSWSLVCYWGLVSVYTGLLCTTR